MYVLQSGNIIAYTLICYGRVTWTLYHFDHIIVLPLPEIYILCTDSLSPSVSRQFTCSLLRELRK